MEATVLLSAESYGYDSILMNAIVGVPMPSPKIVDALLALETQKVPSLPVAALILGAVSQVEGLIEVADRVCDPIFRHPIKPTTNCGNCPLS